MIAPNCGPFAVSVLTGTPVNEMMSYFKESFKYGGNWKGRTRGDQVPATLRKFNVLVTLSPATKTLAKFAQSEANPQQKYLVRVAGHWVSIIGGDIVDQHGTLAPAKHHRRKARLKDVYLVKEQRV